MPPKLNHRRALFVLAKIDQILSWQQQAERERDTRFVELGRYLCEVRAGQYWRIDNLKSFDEFLERKFPESRRKAYYLMAIHEQLPRQIHRDLREIGWTKATDLAKVAHREGQRFDCATWLHKAMEMPKEEFKREVTKHLTGKDTEPWEMLYFKVYKSQLAVMEQALETASMMLGGTKIPRVLPRDDLRGLLGGSKFGRSGPANVIQLDSPVFRVPPRRREARTPRGPARMCVSSIRPRRPRVKLERDSYRLLCRKILQRDGWRCQQCGRANGLEVHHIRFRSALGDDDLDNLVTLCSECHRTVHRHPCGYNG